MSHKQQFTCVVTVLCCNVFL